MSSFVNNDAQSFTRGSVITCLKLSYRISNCTLTRFAICFELMVVLLLSEFFSFWRTYTKIWCDWLTTTGSPTVFINLDFRKAVGLYFLQLGFQKNISNTAVPVNRMPCSLYNKTSNKVLEYSLSIYSKNYVNALHTEGANRRAYRVMTVTAGASDEGQS